MGHNELVHPVVRYCCPYCTAPVPICFDTQSALDAHIYAAHKTFHCPFCSQRFFTQEDLNAHIAEAHPNATFVHGHVTDLSTHQPVSGVEMTAYVVPMGPIFKTVYTDSAGYYIITGLAPGYFLLSVYHSSYLPTYTETGINGGVTVMDFGLWKPY